MVSPSFSYPNIRRDESVVEELHGHSVADPYRWLEDPDSAETKKFVEEQSKLTDGYLEKFSHKSQYIEKLTALWNYEKFGPPKKRGDAYYFGHNSGLQQQSVWYKQKTLDAAPEVFFDPNLLSEDGTVALGTYDFSEDGAYFAYALSKSGSDWQSIKIKQCADGKDLDDQLEYVKFSSISWTKDGQGFFYLRYPEPAEAGSADLGTETDVNLNAQLYYHRLHTSQKEDILVYRDPENPTYMFSGEVSDCGHYVLLNISKGAEPKNKVYIAKLPSAGTDKESKVDTTALGSLEWFKILDIWEGSLEYITNDDNGVFYFNTNLHAPRYRIVKFDLNAFKHKAGETVTELPALHDIVPQHATDVLNWATCVDNNKLLVHFTHDVKSKLTLHHLASGDLIQEIPLPGIGTITSLSAKKSQSEVFFGFESFLTPGSIYRLDCSGATPTVKLFKQPKLANYNADEFVSEQQFYLSKDGTKIPVFIVHHKDVKKGEANPVFLYGYGGFNITIGPTFSPNFLTFAKHLRGVVAIANIRGGGEYGEDWHQGGMLHKKQNVFDDFQAAAKYLVAQGYTNSHQKVAINGGSNGGLLVGACVNQAPQLFGCAVADVGVLDMLRFHKFTIGHAWTSDYGNPDEKADFEYLLKYSPYHTIKKQNYPPTMLVTSDHDDRVVPLHSFKYIAALQHANPTNKHPLLIRIEMKAGHGAGMPTSKRINNLALKMSFIGLSLDCKWFE
ncbi:hypothetical protein RI367_007134 [Sorochytrium milnesiophthora]